MFSSCISSSVSLSIMVPYPTPPSAPHAMPAPGNTRPWNAPLSLKLPRQAEKAM